MPHSEEAQRMRNECTKLIKRVAKKELKKGMFHELD
ncbi:MAG: hypothetical protein ACI97K_003226 [Glaciecola sp.]|jgi:hypothetical protein